MLWKFQQYAITVHVHGPDKAVLIDFDVSQQNAKFVRFDFGNLTGRVTYDDDHDLLLITNAKGKHGGANFAVNGKVFLNDTDAIELKASFEPSPPDDLFAIFAHQLEKIKAFREKKALSPSGRKLLDQLYADRESALVESLKGNKF